MIYVNFFLGGAVCVLIGVIYIIINNLPTITNTYYKANLYDCTKEAQDTYNNALQVSIQTGLKVQQILIDRTQYIPSPIGVGLPQNALYAGTDGRTDAQEELLSKEKLIIVRPAVKRAGTITANAEYIIFTRNTDNAIYRAHRPFEDDIELQTFQNDEGEKLGFYTGLCQNSTCINTFVTSEQHAKFCDEKCRKQYHRN